MGCLRSVDVGVERLRNANEWVITVLERAIAG